MIEKVGLCGASCQEKVGGNGRIRATFAVRFFIYTKPFATMETIYPIAIEYFMWITQFIIII